MINEEHEHPDGTDWQCGGRGLFKDTISLDQLITATKNFTHNSRRLGCKFSKEDEPL